MSYIDAAGDYVDSVISGEIPACLHVKNACKRFVKDLDDDRFVFDVYEAERWCRFLEKIPHVKGKWAAKTEKLKLSPWQIFCTVNIFGFKLKNGRRRFREVYIEVPRKNGKSFWVAGIGVGMLAIDGEHGAEVYCGATSEKQAWEIFSPAKKICEQLPALQAKYGINVNAKTLTILSNGSKFEPVIGNPGDGASPSCGIADEFHEHDNSNLVDTFTTGMGARENPLMIHITTAGSDMGGPCYDKRGDVIKILNGSVEDESIFGIIYTVDDGDDWQTVDAQIKANPNYGISVDAEFLEGQLKQALRSPAKQSAYKTKHLNMWVGAKAAWMNMIAYQKCRVESLSIDDFVGMPCYVGMDLASKCDVAALAILFPPSEISTKWSVFFKFYLPESAILGGNSRYKGWHAAGWLTSTPGNVTDFGYIEDDLKDIGHKFDVREVVFDPYNATQISTRMMAEGLPMVEYGATVKNFSEPMKELEALILKQDINFQDDPVIRWMFGNVVAKLDKKDNIFPDKEKNENKIDGVVALIMSLGRAIINGGTLRSVYDDRGVRSV